MTFCDTCATQHGGLSVKPQPSSFATLPSTRTMDTKQQTSSAISTIDRQEDTRQNGWRKWYVAFQRILPTYLLIHIALLILTIFGPFFNFPIEDSHNVPIFTLWHSWFCWDTGHYLQIASQ